MTKIERNIAIYKRALHLAYCPDGWQTRNEHDDILAVINGRWVVGDWTKDSGRPRKYFTTAEQRAAQRGWQTKSRAKARSHDTD